MSDKIPPILPPTPVEHSTTVGTLLLGVASACERLDAHACVLSVEVPTDRGTLVANLRIEIVQPLPRTH